MAAIEDLFFKEPKFEALTDERLAQLSDLYETRAAFLALAEDAANVKVVIVRSAGHGLKTRDACADDRGTYGPTQHRRLTAQMTLKKEVINAALQAATGYELHELRDRKTIDACMALVGPNAHPALYPALMKLYRLTDP